MSDPCPYAGTREAQGICQDSVENLDEFTVHFDEVCWITDCKTQRIVYVSPAYERIFGTTREELYGDRSSFRPYIHDEDRERVLAALPKQILGTFDEEYRVRDREGRVRWIRSRARPVKNAQGEVVRIFGIASDISEMKAVHERLLMSERMSALGALAAGVGHEINNPLAYAIQYSEWLEEEIASKGYAELRTAAANVSEGLKRIRHVTQGLKLFSRQNDETRAEFDISKTIECSLAMAASEIRSRARVETNLAPGYKCYGVESSFGQVILNLLVNAAQAIPEGNADRNTVTVDMKPVDSGRAIQVEVTDTGTGISAENLARIFEPFFTTKPVGVGTGLGLAICRDLMRSMGGGIEVRSELGKGTTFSVRLPLEAGPKAAEIALPPVAKPVSQSKKSILIVEDETALASALQLMLKKQYMVQVLENGKDAFDRLSAGPLPEVILCDLMMPGMTGMELYEQLRSVRPGCEGHFVFMTGGAFTESARTFLAQVPCPQLSKPFDRSALLKVLEETVSNDGKA